MWAKDGRDDKLVKAAERNKIPIPQAIQDKPTIPEWDLLYWDCFMDLCGTRQLVHGLGSIPWTAINEWAFRHAIVHEDEFEMLRYVVGKMDEWWCNYFRERKK